MASTPTMSLGFAVEQHLSEAWVSYIVPRWQTGAVTTNSPENPYPRLHCVLSFAHGAFQVRTGCMALISSIIPRAAFNWGMNVSPRCNDV